jgi:hypothetical protein
MARQAEEKIRPPKRWLETPMSAAQLSLAQAFDELLP